MYTRNAKIIQKKYLEYLIPSVLSTAALAAAALVDKILVGIFLGAEAIAGLGACNPFIAFGNAIFLLFSVGSSTVASIALGERNKDKANKSYSTGIYFGFLFCLTIVLLLEFFAPQICRMMCYGNDLLAVNMCTYLRPLLFAYPMLFITLGIAQFMRIDGHPQMASYIAVVANLVNLVFDYVFIKYMKMGITGAGLSTTLGYASAIFMVLPWLFSKDKSFKLVNIWTAAGSVFKEVLSAGSERFFYYIADVVKNIILNLMILHFLGSAGLSVLTVCISLIFFSTSITNGGAEAFRPIVGSLLGAKDLFGIKECVKSALKFVLSGCVVFTLILFFFSLQVASLFGLNGGDTAAIVPTAFRFLAVSYIFIGMTTVLQAHYNTTKRHKIATTMSVLSNMVYLCAFIFLFALIRPTILWAGFPSSYIATLITTYIYVLFIQKKEKVSGYLLLQKPSDDMIIHSVTIEATKESAIGLSKQITENASFLQLDSTTTNHIAVAVEEMAIMAADKVKVGQKPPLIDILFVLDKNEKTVSFRDNGIPFNPLEEDSQKSENESNVPGSSTHLLKSIAKSADFSRQLGFNTTVLSF